jgi:hypothetical protein
MASVSTECPFCGGSAVLMVDVPVGTTADAIAEQWAGKQIECEHHGCGKKFWVRRTELKVRRPSGKRASASAD